MKASDKDGLQAGDRTSETIAAAGQYRFNPDDQPSPPDPETAKGRIFLEATTLFAKRGFRGASTRSIAEAADVQQVMINYYFGTKERLYEEILRYEGGRMLAVIFGESPDGKTPEEMLIDTPIRLMTVLHDHPLWAALLRREIAEGAKHLRNALRDVSEHGPLGANLHFHDAYLTAVKAGTVVELPVESVRECLLAIGYSAIYLAPLISMINERDFHDEDVWEEWKLTLSTILKRGLLTPPGYKIVEEQSGVDGALPVGEQDVEVPTTNRME